MDIVEEIKPGEALKECLFYCLIKISKRHFEGEIKEVIVTPVHCFK